MLLSFHIQIQIHALLCIVYIFHERKIVCPIITGLYLFKRVCVCCVNIIIAWSLIHMTRKLISHRGNTCKKYIKRTVNIAAASNQTSSAWFWIYRSIFLSGQVCSKYLCRRLDLHVILHCFKFIHERKIFHRSLCLSFFRCILWLLEVEFSEETYWIKNNVIFIKTYNGCRASHQTTLRVKGREWILIVNINRYDVKKLLQLKKDICFGDGNKWKPPWQII